MAAPGIPARKNGTRDIGPRCSGVAAIGSFSRTLRVLSAAVGPEESAGIQPKGGAARNVFSVIHAGADFIGPCAIERKIVAPPRAG